MAKKKTGSKKAKKEAAKKSSGRGKSTVGNVKASKAPKVSKSSAKKSPPKKIEKKIDSRKFPTIKIHKDTDIAMDFATKTYEVFNKLVKSVVLFGSTARQTKVAGSDIDIIIILDDVSVNWDGELVAWYREELDKILRRNPYRSDLHINTIRLSTWWDDLMRGDPVVINILRYGEAMIDFGGFFEPLKFLLLKGKIKSTPEAVYSCLERAPQHFVRSKMAELGTIEGLYWAMVDSAHAALIARNVLPPSPEHVPLNLRETFVNEGSLKMKYVTWYRDLLFLHKKIAHGEIKDLKGVEIDMWQDRTEEFMKIMAQLVDKTIGTRGGSPGYMKNTEMNLGLDNNKSKKPTPSIASTPANKSLNQNIKPNPKPVPEIPPELPDKTKDKTEPNNSQQNQTSGMDVKK